MKKLTIPALSLSLLFLLGACGADKTADTAPEAEQQTEQATEAEAVTITDAAGNELTFDLKSADGRALYVSGKNHVKNADGSIAFDKVFLQVLNK